MCIVSNVGDYYCREFPKRYPDWYPNTSPLIPVVPSGVSQEEFDKLKKEVETMRELLKMAKKIDEATGQPDCQMEEKVAMIRKLAELVGVDLENLLP